MEKPRSGDREKGGEAEYAGGGTLGYRVNEAMNKVPRVNTK